MLQRITAPRHTHSTDTNFTAYTACLHTQEDALGYLITDKHTHIHIGYTIDIWLYHYSQYNRIAIGPTITLVDIAAKSTNYIQHTNSKFHVRSSRTFVRTILKENATASENLQIAPDIIIEKL